MKCTSLLMSLGKDEHCPQSTHPQANEAFFSAEKIFSGVITKLYLKVAYSNKHY